MMFFIVFEGLDGSGKSSLMQFLEKELMGRGIDFIRTREPGGTDLGEEIRHLILRNQQPSPSPRTEALLYQASRAQHVDQVISPALAAGQWVICDRFAASSVAFQGEARGLGRDHISQLNQFSTGGLSPDLTILLDISIEEAEKRRQKRSLETGERADRIEQEARAFHEKVRKSFLEQAAQDPQKWFVLDAASPAASLWMQLRQKLIENKVLPVGK